MGRLQDQMKRDLELKNYSPKTRSCYLASARSFALHFHRSPEALGDPEIREYLHYLIKDKEVSQSAVNQTYSALKFLYETTLKRDWDGFRIPRAKMSKRLPVILSQQEMEVSFFGHRESKASSDLDDDLFGGFEAERGGSFKGIGYR